MAERKKGLSFRVKLDLAFLLLSLTLVGGAVMAAQYSATLAAREKIDRDFARTAGQLERSITSRLTGFDDVAAAALSDALFRSYLGNTIQRDADMGLDDPQSDNGLDAAEGDDNPIVKAHGVFFSAETPLFQERYPVVAIVNAEGTLIFSKGDRARYGGSVKNVPLVARTLKEHKAAEIWPAKDTSLTQLGLIPAGGDDELYLVMGREIATAKGVVGVVFVGEALSQGLLPELEALSNADVVLRTGDAFLARVGDDPVRTALLIEAAKGRTQAKAMQDHKLYGESYLGVAATIPGLVAGRSIGEAYLLRSLESELGPFNQRLRTALLIVALAALILSLIVGSQMSGRLTHPLSSLDKAVRQVRTGDLSVKVPVTSRDEIGELANSFNEMTEGLKQRDQIKATFKRYLAPAVVEEMLKNPEKLQLGGEDRELSILFSDLVGFTSLSEGRKASELVALLNEYFDEVGQAIVRRGGTLDKFAGDSVMCFFGAPIVQEDHRARALLSAIEHLRVVDDVQKRWAALGRPVINCRIGVNSGHVVVGNIGSRDGQDYTVIGDAVNLASRLEGANKEYGTRLMVSEDSLVGVEQLVHVRELDSLRVKGKAIPVRVFEVLGERGQVSDTSLKVAAMFAEGLAIYRAQKFADAKKIFDGCLTLDPNDGPAKTFAARCVEFQSDPPEANWDGVFKMTTK
ncbi:MAG: HAMP domain-containing protein [Deltaproteobacteria bacterium]|nr:HAMP domain-containing protein [Deltaproteobacteria bacterium]